VPGEQALVEGACVDADADGDADDLASGGGEFGDLLQGGVDVRGERCGHGLDADGCAAADIAG
jgi:hypothetical protein